MGSVVKQCALTREVPHRLEQKVFHLVPATAACTVTGTATGLFWVCGGGGSHRSATHNASPTTGGPRQRSTESLTSEIRLTPLYQEVRTAPGFRDSSNVQFTGSHRSHTLSIALQPDLDNATCTGCGSEPVIRKLQHSHQQHRSPAAAAQPSDWQQSTPAGQWAPGPCEAAQTPGGTQCIQHQDG